jgi:hypothetical protein
MKTFSDYQHRRILDSENGRIADGDYVKDDLIIRVKDGFLNDVKDEDGNLLPAIQYHDMTHYEHWKNGVLHNDIGPAVVDVTPQDAREEWWLEGKKLDNPLHKMEIK